jgi:hypothetical protein
VAKRIVSVRKLNVAKNIHIGSSFDEFLAEDGRFEEATAIAIKRVIAWQFQQAMKLSGIASKSNWWLSEYD